MVPPPKPPHHEHEYYAQLPLSLASYFRNLDTNDVYRAAEAALSSVATRNFVVDFGGHPDSGGQAWCALNLPDEADGVKALLSAERPLDLSLRTRWINIFNPYEQRNIVAAITGHYGFSPRLTKVITTPPGNVDLPREPAPSERPPSRRERVKAWATATPSGSDLEALGGSGRNSLQVPSRDIAMRMLRGNMNYMNLAQNVWHWHAVEYGNSYICTGFNHLHQVSRTPAPGQEVGAKTAYNDFLESDDDDNESVDGYVRQFDKGDYNPEGRRLWSWLILCDDGTVISIHEPPGLIPPKELLVVRKNMLTVFRSLSVSDLALAEDTESTATGLDELPFRHHSPDNTNVTGGPSLLLYYLFDDWYSAYNFVIGRGAPYSDQFMQLRNDMHSNPRLTHLSKLNRLTRQLAILKRMYETRKMILENILYRQEKSDSKEHSLRNKAEGDMTESVELQRVGTFMGRPDVLGVMLSPLAIAKFERARDRIRLYVLGELDALLVEKTELENLTFNLISLKQSATVELLTRVTIWLTKFTFLFLPLTLVTGYFSMQLKDIEGVYSIKTFWGSAGVSVAITILVLYTVSKNTGTMQVMDMWRGVRQVWFGWVTWGKGKKKKLNKKRQIREKRKELYGQAA